MQNKSDVYAVLLTRVHCRETTQAKQRVNANGNQYEVLYIEHHYIIRIIK